MSRSNGGPQEIAVPISVFGALRTELEKEFGIQDARFIASVEAAKTMSDAKSWGAA